MPIELPPAFDRPATRKEGVGVETRDGHTHTTTSPTLGSPENPILVDQDDEEGCTESEPGSAQYPILIEDRDDPPQHDDTALESDSKPGAGTRPALLRDSTPPTRQQSDDYSRGGSRAALSSRMEDAVSLDESAMDKRDVDIFPHTTVQRLEDAPCGDTTVKPVAIARGASCSRDATLIDESDLDGDTPADGAGTILWRHVAFRVVRSPYQGELNELLAQVTLPQTEDEMQSLVIPHYPNPLFDILGYLLALAIRDDIFATGVTDVEQVLRLEIPPHTNDVGLEVKETKRNLPVFRRPAHLSNGYRSSTTLGLLGDGSEPNAGCASAFNVCCSAASSVFEHYYHYNVASIAGSHAEGDQENAFSEHRVQDALWHRRTEDGKVEYLHQRSPTWASEDREEKKEDVSELLRVWTEQKGMVGQALGNRQARKRRARLPSRVLRSSRVKRHRQL